MSIPLWYLLLPLAAACIFSGIFLLFNLFDMGTYGVSSPATKTIIYLYIGGFLAILFFTGMGLATIDWSARLNLAAFLPEPGANTQNLGL